MGHESANSLVTMDRALPWLQDTAEANAWSAWSVTYRDVIVLDERNVVVGVYNLTSNDLANVANADALKELIRVAAGVGTETGGG